MSRWVSFWLCIIVGSMMLFLGWLVPAHLRVIDSSVLMRAGRGTRSITQTGSQYLQQKNYGAAELFLQAGDKMGLAGQEQLRSEITQARQLHPVEFRWGGPPGRMDDLFSKSGVQSIGAFEPFSEFVVHRANREKVLELLQRSSNPAAQVLLATRGLTNTVFLPPSRSSAGQAFDAALSVCGLLIEDGRLTAPLRNSIFHLADAAARGGKSQDFEQVAMDFLSLGQRFNWGQLTVFVQNIETLETLNLLSGFSRQASNHLSLVFCSVALSGKPAEVARYLQNFNDTGLQDLGNALRYRAGGMEEFLARQKRLHVSPARDEIAQHVPLDKYFAFAAGQAWKNPWLAFGFKLLLYLAAGFLFAAGIHALRGETPVMERPLEVRGFSLAREILFALGFLLAVLLLSEPFLAQESQKVQMTFRLRLPTVGRTIPAVAPLAKPKFMNQLTMSLLTLLLFFILQGLIYTACVLKLAEIKRQMVAPRIKLKLLENEDHLFDAGLYLGFVGTIICLILVSLNVIKFSLMAAYSSTSFGIIFVSFFKIFHLRPARRKMLLEAELSSQQPVARSTAPLAVPS